MAIIEKGRICIITKGADTGKEAVIKEIIDKNFVTIIGEKVKERRLNIKHLEPTTRTTSTMPTPKLKPAKEKKPQQTKSKEAKKEKPKK